MAFLFSNILTMSLRILWLNPLKRFRPSPKRDIPSKVLYSHIRIYAYIHIYMFMQHHNDIIITTHAVINDARRKGQEDFFNNNIYLSFYCKGSKGLFQGCMWEGAGDRTWTVISWPHCYDRHVVSFLFPWCWGPLHRGSRGPPRSDVAFLTTSGL